MRKICVDEIKTLLIDVSEPILKDNLSSFVSFQLVQNSIVKDGDSSIFCEFLKISKKYFIANIPNLNATSYIEPQILKAYYLKTNEEVNSLVELFILSNFFAIYENQKLIFFKSLSEEVLDEQIINFVEMSLKLAINKVTKIDLEEERVLQEEFEKNIKKLKPLNLLKNSSLKEFKRFISFCFFCIVLVGGFFTYQNFTKDSLQNKQENKVEYPKKELLSAKIYSLVDNINSNFIELVNINLTQQWLNITLRDKDKNRLIDFLKENKGEIKSLFFNNEVGKYELSTSIKLF